MNAPFLLHFSSNSGCVCEAFPCWALMPYRGVARSMIITWKHAHSRGLDKTICELWRWRCEELRAVLMKEILDQGTDEKGTNEICVVPAPSAWARKHDGRLVAAKLARSAAQCLSVHYCEYVHIRPAWKSSASQIFSTVCACVRPVGKYRVAKIQERKRKRSRVFTNKDFSGKSVIIIDDVLASGATASAIARAVSEAGGTVLGMMVLACPRYGEHSVPMQSIFAQ